MEVGCDWTISYFDGDATRSVGPISSGASLSSLLDVGLNYLPDLDKAVARLGAVRVVADFVVFETDIPSQHGWEPKSGQYREIWRGQAVGERHRDM
jgi:hypothetical protein